MHFSHGLDYLLSTAGRGDVDDNEPRFSSLANSEGQTPRGCNDDWVTYLDQTVLNYDKN